jgi:hypothetical protein
MAVIGPVPFTCAQRLQDPSGSADDSWIVRSQAFRYLAPKIGRIHFAGQAAIAAEFAAIAILHNAHHEQAEAHLNTFIKR